MKKEDAMQGYWSFAVDEKRASLAVDNAVLVGASAWWRMMAMDGVENVDLGICCGRTYPPGEFRLDFFARSGFAVEGEQNRLSPRARIF